MNKKADANMWWIIIGAVIALVVLVILMLLFTSKTGRLESGLLDCKSKGGNCDFSDPKQCVGTVSSAFDCTGELGKVCCFPSKKE